MWQMSGYTKLFNSILASTIWREPNEVRIVWITLLAMAGKNGMAEGSVPGVADFARLPVEVTRLALERLTQPDPDSRSQEYQGRRIKAVDGGWFILNHAKYRAKLGADERREYLKLKQREYRSRDKSKRRQRVNTVDKMSTRLTQTEAEADTETKEIKNTRRASRSVPDAFADFWAIYPNRKGKQAAIKAWTKLNPNSTLFELILSALVWQVKQPDWNKEFGRFVPHASSWLNGRRWEDEPFEVPKPRVSSYWQDECQHQPKCPNAFFHEAKLMP